MKRLTALVLLLAVCISTCVECFANSTVKDESSSDIAFVTYGEKVVMNNISGTSVGMTSDKHDVATRDGRSCWIIGGYGISSDTLGIALKSDFKDGVDSGDVYEVEVDYFDVETGGYFWLGYDGIIPNPLGTWWGSMAEERVVYTTGTKTWKTEKFVITNAAFKNRLSAGKVASDLTLSTRTSNASTANADSKYAIPFGEVRIKRLKDYRQIRNVVVIDEFANTFKWYQDKKIIHNNLENLAKTPVEAELTFEIINTVGTIVFSKSEKLSFETEEKRIYDLDISEFDKCGVYSLYVTVKNLNNNTESRFKESEFAIIKTDPDGIKNEDHYTNSHTSRVYFDGIREEAIQLISNGNFAGIRESISGNATADRFRETLNYSKKYGLDFISLISAGWGNKNPKKGYDSLPDTQEQYELSQKRIENHFSLYEKDIRNFEGQNEPDLFVDNCEAENYMKIHAFAENKLKELSPDKKFAFLCWASWGESNLKKTEEMLKNYGLDELLPGNAVAVHGYQRPEPERSGMINSNWMPYVNKFREYGVDREEYEIWLTEYGGTTYDSHMPTSRIQGSHVVRTNVLNEISLGMEKQCVYVFEEKGRSEVDRESQFGTVRSPYPQDIRYNARCLPEDAFVIITAYNYLAAQSEPIKYIIKDTDGASVSLHKSQKFNSDFLIASAVKKPTTITIDLGINKIDVYDEYGNKEEMFSGNGIYTIFTTQAPQYIFGNFARTKVIEENKLIVNQNINAVANDVFEVEIANNLGKTLTAEVVTNANISDVEPIALKSGLNKVIIKNNSGVGENFEIKIRLYSEGKLIGIAPVEILSCPIAVGDLDIQLKSLENLNKWEAIVTVKNSSIQKMIRGEIEILTEKFSPKKKISLGNIPKGKTARIKFSLPEIRDKAAETVEYRLSFSNGLTIEGAKLIDTTIAPYAENTPVIDGVLSEDEWAEGTMMQSNSAEQMAVLDNFKWNGPDDLSTKAYAAWDDENFYMAFDVTDDKFYQVEKDGMTWNGDSIQFGIYVGNNDEYIEIGQGGNNFNQLCFALTEDGAQAWRHLVQHSDLHNVGMLPEDSYKGAISRKDNHTYYEIAVKWSELLKKDQKVSNRQKVGFAYVVNDNDGTGRKGGMLYGGGIFYVKDVSQFVYMSLLK